MRWGMLLGLAVLVLSVSVPTTDTRADEGDPPEMGGDVRIRTEYRSPFDYITTDGGDPTGDDGTFARTRLHFWWEPREDIGVFVQAQDSRTWGFDSITTADPDIDMKQVYLQLDNVQQHHGLTWLGSNDVDVKIGRIVLPTFGDGYILAANDWANLGPSAFDGIWFDASVGSEELAVDIDFLYADLVNTDPYVSGPIGPAEGTVLWGANIGIDDVDWIAGEVYAWFFDGPKDMDEQFYGFRIRSNAPEESALRDLLVVFEYALDTGERGAVDVDANFWVLRGEYAIPVDGLNPVIGVGMSHTTGSPSTASDNETWVSPLDWNHARLGHYDLQDNSNVDDFFITTQITPFGGFEVHLDYHILTLDEEFDGWYTLAAGTAGAGGTITDDDVGSEIDLYAMWSVAENLEMQFGWSIFMPGDAVEQAAGGGFDDGGNFFYVQLMVPFGAPAK